MTRTVAVAGANQSSAPHPVALDGQFVEFP